MISITCARWALREDSQRRVSFFMQKAAIAVMSEDSETVNHSDRVIYAQKVIDGDPNTASVAMYTLGTATNATIAAMIDADTLVDDNSMEFSVNSLFDAFAG
jgi:hypothetical protein